MKMPVAPGKESVMRGLRSEETARLIRAPARGRDFTIGSP
jgi:hypothetical protein